MFLRTFLLLGLLFFLGDKYANSTKVYICNSSNAKRYHYNSKCRGLSNCQHKIIQTTLDKAKRSKKTLCGWED
ncbi:hypothetical protein ATK78_1621 [Pedobacter metabolipauper]|uniref:Uncharacterized protein n=1 Tax=Pedobacter metabolipauper TaxID=425513 RepID=A0A4V3D166_9SPHI|nr:hypothetical protein ATK78_1621 [Pedobacter metabolipauper]